MMLEHAYNLPAVPRGTATQTSCARREGKRATARAFGPKQTHHHHQVLQTDTPREFHAKQECEKSPAAEARPRATTESPCDTLIVNDQTLDFRLRWVERCLAQLVQEETTNREREDAEPNMKSSSWTQLKWRARRLDGERARLAAMLKIYGKLLRCPPAPLELKVQGEAPLLIQDARCQVLALIESLAGYCDSINSLRCILKSGHVRAVIWALDAILEQMRQAGAQKCQLLPPVEESHEFRIVQEWKF